MVQIIVYTGAVMMLFLFVLMIVGVDSSDSLVETIRGQRTAGILFALGFVILVAGPSARGVGAARGQSRPGQRGLRRQRAGHRRADLLALRLRLRAHVRAADLGRARRHAARTPGAHHGAQDAAGAVRGTLRRRRLHRPKPPPGLYARHNAVDTPALLPDGSVAPDSVPGPLQARGSVRKIDPADIAEVSEVLSGKPAIPGATQGEDS